MAKRIAVFVEGQTEQLFIQKLLVEMAGRHNITIDSVQARGSGAARTVTVRGHSPSTTVYHALICDCGSDNTVASDINDNYASLASQGYSLVLGLRDVFPSPNSAIPAMQAAISKVIPKGPIPAHMVLAIREIEAWFIVEDWHYPKIKPELTKSLILTELGIDTTRIQAEAIDRPADTLHTIYKLVGFAYHKKRSQVERTVEALDYARLDIDISTRVSALGELCRHINTFLS